MCVVDCHHGGCSNFGNVDKNMDFVVFFVDRLCICYNDKHVSVGPVSVVQPGKMQSILLNLLSVTNKQQRKTSVLFCQTNQ